MRSQLRVVEIKREGEGRGRAERERDRELVGATVADAVEGEVDGAKERVGGEKGQERKERVFTERAAGEGEGENLDARVREGGEEGGNARCVRGRGEAEMRERELSRGLRLGFS